MSKKKLFLILSIIFLVSDLVLALIIFKPSVFKTSKQEKRIEVADEAGIKFYVNSKTVGQYEKFEISFNSPKNYANPFNPKEVDVQAHFTSPSGQESVSYGFWYQAYELEIKEVKFYNPAGYEDSRTKENLVQKDEPLWKIRFAPQEVGEYKYYIIIKEGVSDNVIKYPRDGSLLSFKSISPSPAASLKVQGTSKSNSKGYLKISEKSPNYFAFANGETFFGIGRGPHDVYSSLLNNLEIHKKYDMNMVQAEFEAPFELENKRIGHYDLERSYVGDLVVEKAEALGIYLQMVFDHWSNWVDNTGWEDEGLEKFEKSLFLMWADNPYNAKNGGPLHSPQEYFSNEEAKQYLKNRIRYYIARWGYSTNVLAWQFWGEYDNVLGLNLAPSSAQEIILNWHQEMSEYIKSLDPNHLVTSNENVEKQPGSEKVWELKTIDYITAHNYANFPELSLADEVENYYPQFNKPIIVQELPCDGLCRHNVIWRLSLNGLAGTPMIFSYNEEHDEYQKFYHFIKDIDVVNYKVDRLNITNLTEEQYFEPLIFSSERKTRTIREGGYYSPVNIYGIGSSQQAYLWINDLTYNSYEVGEKSRVARESGIKYEPETMTGVKFQLEDMEDGKYQVEFWDTRTGEVDTKEATASQGSLIIEVPSFKKDIAVKLFKA